MTLIYTGHSLAAEIAAQTRADLARLGRVARAAILWHEADGAMAAYVARQKAQAAELGIEIDLISYKSLRTLRAISQLGEQGYDAILPLYPLPKGLEVAAVAEIIGPARDIDGQHVHNAGRLAQGLPTASVPATAQAVLRILQRVQGSLRGAEVVLIGASTLIGRPLAMLLLQQEATVTLCHAATRDLKAHSRRAEILVSAAGVAGLIGGADIREGAVLIDVSILRGPEGLVGDIDRPSVMGKAALLSHVPEGVGPVTTACLFQTLAAQALRA